MEKSTSLKHNTSDEAKELYHLLKTDKQRYKQILSEIPIERKGEVTTKLMALIKNNEPIGKLAKDAISIVASSVVPSAAINRTEKILSTIAALSPTINTTTNIASGLAYNDHNMLNKAISEVPIAVASNPFIKPIKATKIISKIKNPSFTKPVVRYEFKDKTINNSNSRPNAYDINYKTNKYAANSDEGAISNFKPKDWSKLRADYYQLPKDQITTLEDDVYMNNGKMRDLSVLSIPRDAKPLRSIDISKDNIKDITTRSTIPELPYYLTRDFHNNMRMSEKIKSLIMPKISTM